VVQSIHGPNGGLDGVNFVGKILGIWRNILKIRKAFDKVNIPLNDWFQVELQPDLHDVRTIWALDPGVNFPLLPCDMLLMNFISKRSVLVISLGSNGCL